jgi:transposase
MPAIKYIVSLEPAERARLESLLQRGKHASRKLNRARILLKADEAWQDEAIVEALQVGFATVGRIRKRFVEEGLEAALEEKPRPGQRRKLTGKQEARLIAEACSPAPHGRVRWTLRLLAERMVALELTDSISHEAIRQVLKKTNSSRGRNNNGVFRK